MGKTLLEDVCKLREHMLRRRQHDLSLSPVFHREAKAARMVENKRPVASNFGDRHRDVNRKKENGRSLNSLNRSLLSVASHGMEKAGSSTGDDSNTELEDRDPNSLNQHLQVMWDDVIGEPEGIRSPECAWRLSGHCFRLSRGCCYVFLSVLVAPLLALCLGFTFACLAFQHIWCLAPCLRVWKITCAATRNFLTAVTQAIVRPVMDSLGYLFHNIRVSSQKLPDGPPHKDDVLVV